VVLCVLGLCSALSAHVHSIAAIADYDVSDRVGGLGCETLVIHGDSDSVVPHSNGVKIAEAVPKSKFVTLPGVGHVFWDMDGGAACKHILQFLGVGTAQQLQSRL